ncbi:hypothetical protein DAEQUDRAFT_535153 [Daedalea quercina L-15889]|uniref:Uncharacterized protein n=1 Tax=Daedalea quercina L-15889 TaxID=1314783 RepID=A0A165M7N0_9APHY|nr:hypothetical protein DAEQUDRAFT_535153 [Daedalea quercina L-15889]
MAEQDDRILFTAPCTLSIGTLNLQTELSTTFDSILTLTTSSLLSRVYITVFLQMSFHRQFMLTCPTASSSRRLSHRIDCILPFLDHGKYFSVVKFVNIAKISLVITRLQPSYCLYDVQLSFLEARCPQSAVFHVTVQPQTAPPSAIAWHTTVMQWNLDKSSPA